MRITVVGTGYVGLVTGVCLADTGNQVVCCDIDAGKVARLREGQSPIFEPGLSDLLASGLTSGRLRFTTDLGEGVRHAQVLFIAIGTPPRADGAPDLSAIEGAVREMAPHIQSRLTVVMKSTVPVGTGGRLEALFASSGASSNVRMVSNPEFLKEGTAVDDFQRPDRVVIGANDAEAAELVRELHLPFVRNQKPIFVVKREAAELIKYAANAYLAMRVSYINHVASVCEAAGVDVDEVIRGIGSDHRIGYQFLYPGVGYGGSCFPKDVLAFQHTGEEYGVPSEMIAAVHTVNQRQQRRLLDFIEKRFGRDLKGKRFAVWGCSFKPRTDDIREAPALQVIGGILERGGAVHAYDPKALPHVERLFGAKIGYATSMYDALDQADALAICTEWSEFRSPDFDQFRARMSQPVIFDGRNVYQVETMRRQGFEYFSIGRPPLRPGAPRP